MDVFLQKVYINGNVCLPVMNNHTMIRLSNLLDDMINGPVFSVGAQAGETPDAAVSDEISDREIEVFVKMSTPFFTPTKPTGIIMVGGPGSGKSKGQSKTIELLGLDESTFVKVDPDRVLTTLLNSDNDQYPKAAPVLKTLINKTLESKKNIVFDFTGRSIVGSMVNVTRLRQNGYNVVVSITLLDTETAVDRAKKRSLREGRSVDTDYLKLTYDAIKKLVPDYIKNGLFDSVFVFDNNGESIKCTLAFDRKEALKVADFFKGEMLSVPSLTAVVCLYDKNGPVDSVEIPLEINSKKLIFKYSSLSLPDWVLEVNKGSKTMVDSNSRVSYPFDVAIIAGYITLSIIVSEDNLISISSLPQADSEFWKDKSEKSIKLDYVFSQTGSISQPLINLLTFLNAQELPRRYLLRPLPRRRIGN
jgi:predicted ABC-type ATPase